MKAKNEQKQTDSLVSFAALLAFAHALLSTPVLEELSFRMSLTLLATVANVSIFMLHPLNNAEEQQPSRLCSVWTLQPRHRQQ